MNTLTAIRERIAKVHAWDHEDAPPEVLDIITALADDAAALADIVESRNAFALTEGSVLVIRDVWGHMDPSAKVYFARLEKVLKRWKVGLLVLPPDPVDKRVAEESVSPVAEPTLRDIAVGFLSLPLTTQIAVLRRLGIDPDPSGKLNPRELHDGMADHLVQVRERGLIDDLAAAVKDVR